jgi:hypothetical protein
LAEFDVAKARRWARFDPARQLSRRRDAELPFVTADDLAGPPLLLDTGVYIHQLKGQAPAVVENLITTRVVNHSTVAVQELMHTVGVLDPSDPRSRAALKGIEIEIEAIPAHRLFVPDADVLGRAALLAGMLCRLQGYSKDARLKALQDCTLFLQGQKLGFTILTANVAEFDYLLQLIPAGRVLFYRQ